MAQAKQRVAQLFREIPWLGVLGTHLWRLRQARFSVGAVGVVFDDAGCVLLLEHAFHPKYPWGLPGGWVDRHEAPATTVAREVREETGLQVRVLQPLLADLGACRGHLDLAYLCQLEGGEILLSGEILAYQWREPSDLSDLFAFQRMAIEQAVQWREASR